MRRGGYRDPWRYLPILALWAAGALAAPALSPRRQAADFDAMWSAVDAGYADFEGARAAWKSARERWQPRAASALTRADFVGALEGALCELHDDHVTLSEHSAAFPRRIAVETDVWVRWQNGVAVVEAVRTFGDADVAGLRPDHVVTLVRDVPIDRLVRERLGSSSPNVGAVDWALRHVLAGPRAGTHRIEVRDGGGLHTLQIERRDAPLGNGPPIVARRMGDERDIGYTRVRIGAADERLAEHFDGAFNYLTDTRALILDLRENAGPGSP